MADDYEALKAEYENLIRACLNLLPDMPTGWEVAGQSMDISIQQHNIREWRKAVVIGARRLTT